MFEVELEFIDLEISQVLDQLQEGLQIGHPPPRNVQHHAAPGKVRIILDRELRQPPAMLAKELAQRGHCGAQAARVAITNPDASASDRQHVPVSVMRGGTIFHRGN